METRKSVIAKVTRYVGTAYQGNWRNAFNAYAKGGKIDRSTVVQILEDAEVGTLLGRQLLATQVMLFLDADGDGYLTWAEFDAITHVDPPTPVPPIPPSP